jgi:hypothetical protein
VKVTEQTIWEATLGAGFEYGGQHWKAYHFESGDYDTLGVLSVTAEDSDDESLTVTKKITAADLVAAYEKAVASDYHHCGTHYVLIDEADSCWADGILQIAIYGDIIYG